MMWRITLLSDWGIVRMMAEIALEVNRAFSADAVLVPRILGRCPRLGLIPRLWRYFARKPVLMKRAHTYASRACSHCRAKRATSREFFRSSLSLICAR